MKFSRRNLFTFQYLICLIVLKAQAQSYCTDFNPCKNMADCYKSEDDPTRVRCVCKRGFNGNLCEICKLYLVF